MSTQINVTVDRRGLLQRNQQQTTANRQARLEADGTRAAAAKGNAQRAAAQAAAGLDANGNPLPSGQITSWTKEEPAAFRNTKQSIYFGPKYEPFIVFDYATGAQTSYKYYFLINSIKVKQASGTATGLLPGRFYLRGYELINASSGEVNRTSFEAGAGPSGSNAIKLLSTRSFGVNAVNTRAAGEGPANDANSLYGNQLTFECFVKTEFGLDSDYAGLTVWMEDFQLRIDNDGSSYFRVYPSTGGASVTHPIGVLASNLGSWTHLAVVLANSVYRLYVGGLLAGEFSSVSPYALFEIRQLTLSTASVDSGRTDILWLSSLRISKGARYSGISFTPPTSIS